MLRENSTLTLQDLENFDWHRIALEFQEMDCNKYSGLFYQKAQSAKQQGNVIEEEISTLFHAITSLCLDLDMPDQPYQPRVFTEHIRFPTIEDIYDCYLLLLREFIYEITDFELRARVSDVIWISKRDYKMARLSAEAYLEIFSLMKKSNFYFAITRLERASQLASFFGKDDKLLEIIAMNIEEAIMERNENEIDSTFESIHLLELLLEIRLGDSEKFANLSEIIANKSEQDYEWYRARAYWSIASKWHQRNKDTANRRNCLLALAETYVKESEQVLSNDSKSYVMAASHLQSAIEALRRAGGASDRVTQLHWKLLEYQEKSVAELAYITAGSIDIGDFQRKAREAVKGKSLKDAFFDLAN